MVVSRRHFVKTTVAGAAGLYVGAHALRSGAKELAVLPEEDGYKLWLRYAPLGDAAKNYRKIVRQIQVEGDSPTARVIREELRLATSAMLGATIPADEKNPAAGTILVGTPDTSKFIRQLDLVMVENGGFVIKSIRIGGQPITMIASNSEIGALYGAFHFLRLMQT